MTNTFFTQQNDLAVKKRLIALLVACSMLAIYLLAVIFKMQVVGYDHYRQKVIEQITTSSVSKAKRGTIYDTNMNILATTKTIWRVFLCPVDISEISDDEGKDYAAIIAAGLAPLLSMSRDDIYTKAKKSSTIDVTLKKEIDEATYEKVIDFISKNKLESMVKTEATYSRYYPYSYMAAHTIGFTGADNQGLFGLEYYYNDVLTGKDGYYLYEKDAKGNEMPGGYINYIQPTDGCSIVSTIDTFIQSQLEYTLSEIEKTFDVQSRVTGIVMDTSTGAIYGMATTSGFDLNDPYILSPLYEEKLSSANLDKDSKEYKELKNDLLYTMWQNKAVSEAYEPGSTFKIITVSAGLETGAVTTSNTYNCNGYFPIGGYNISCHKHSGHGHINLAQSLQQSCNPAMIQISAATGAKEFYKYVEAFGYLEKTGIDLPAEGNSIFHKLDNIGPTELATASFGQRFKITPIQQITAIAAVANGGYLVTPYLVKEIRDADGKTVYTHSTEIKRQVISTETAQTLSAILEAGVSGDGGAKNAAVDGYPIAAKTGTSEKFDILDSNGNSYLRIGSCIGYGPSDQGGVAVLIIVDEPTTAKYGSMVAAPYVSKVLKNILPYLGYEKSQNEAENVYIGQYESLKLDDAIAQIKKQEIKYEIVGSGSTVISQMPSPGTELAKDSAKVILITDSSQQPNVTVPNVVGKKADEASRIIINAGLNLALDGVTDMSIGSGAVVAYQSIAPGTGVKKGTVIKLTFLYTDHTD